ncbi:hypothetical protein JW930_02585 [Candidatus Woesearchaeota archaeon]|nr:hypothetical protein [Candidatus Woesearchaeota archaeon]
MSELISTVTAETLNFEGLFSMKEIFRIIDKYFRTRAFDKKILFDEEFYTSNGKYIHVKAEYYKKWDNYIRMQIRFWLYVHNLVEVEKEVEGQKIKTNNGKITIIFDGFIQSDFRHRWDSKPIYFLIRTLFEKYFYNGKMEYWENISKYIIYELRSELTSYLNMSKYLYTST